MIVIVCERLGMDRDPGLSGCKCIDAKQLGRVYFSAIGNLIKKAQLRMEMGTVSQ